ncbi:MAG: response regulator [Bacteroidales bacterium]|nr:response regulator [Bacteroidales bacterium]
MQKSLQFKKILVVEDDEMNFIYLSQIFKIAKIDIMRAKTGYEALEMVKHFKDIALVLMDIQLPDIDGYETTRKIRKINSTIPIIAQTAARNINNAELAKSAGCTDIIVKPFRMEELMAKMKIYLT